MRLIWSALGALVLTFAAGAAQATPEPWQLGFPPAATPTMADLDALHDLLLWIITIISLFVLALLAIVAVRFRASQNATPSRRTHHTVLEIAWTVIPVLILVVIAIPSFKLLYAMDRVEEPEMTLKAIGRQWYWSYEYPDHGGISFDAYMIPDEELEPGQPRLLATDNHVVLPVETDIRLLTTASDVIHSWAIPRFGVKMDSVPGRLNETWFRIEEPGLYYGQCSELCGAYHGFMPITVEAVTKDEFEAWVEQEQAGLERGRAREVAARAGASVAADN